MAWPDVEVSMSLLAGLALFQGNDGDEALLSLLEVKGSDLSKPHEIDFFLFFPFEGYARFAAKVIGKAGFRIEITRLENTRWHKWMCQAHKNMIPKSRALRRVRFTLSFIAVLGLGEYDGWETGVVK